MDDIFTELNLETLAAVFRREIIVPSIVQSISNEKIERLDVPYLFGYKLISAISRDPKLLMQKINFIDTNCKCIILGYKPRAIFGLEVYRRP